MSDVEVVDKSGTICEPEAFAEARKVVVSRMVKAGLPQDVELFMQFTTIIQALEIAEAVSRGRKKREADGL